MGREMGSENILTTGDFKVWFIKWRSDVFLLKEEYRQLKLREKRLIDGCNI